MAKDRSTRLRFMGTNAKLGSTRFLDTDGDSYRIALCHKKKRKRQFIHLWLGQRETPFNVGIYLNIDHARAIIRQLQHLIDEIEPPVVDTTPHIDDLDDIDQTLVDMPVTGGTHADQHP